MKQLRTCLYHFLMSLKVSVFGYVHVVSPYWVKGKYHLMHQVPPPVLSVLNTKEQRLISKVQAFMEAYSTSIRSKSTGWPKYKFPC